MLRYEKGSLKCVGSEDNPTLPPENLCTNGLNYDAIPAENSSNYERTKLRPTTDDRSAPIQYDAIPDSMEALDPGAQHNGDEATECNMVVLPDGTKQWLPKCNSENTPYIGQEFATLENGVDFYGAYAIIAGFDIRHGTKRRNRAGAVHLKYILCSREGYKPKKMSSSDKGTTASPKKRRRLSTRVGCNARIGFTRRKSGSYKIHALELWHTHCLCSDIGRPFLKINRKLDIGHKIFVANCARANIGSTKSWRLYKEMVGSFSDIGATSTDFCNFRRDLLAYIAGADAQMVVEDMYKNKEMEPDFYFDFDLNEDRELCRLFWADTISRKNFACFGDVMSFDATYSTNRYKLVFVPFTGVDNHKRSITFGAGLIAREDIDSY
ncbi:PREDICTED: protein FAR1-RELATED SEQUENCE 5-like [Ipomoea nil]|uniref:protein FAR1-RELATED SEQUENCE 5-like n=1 Tax=Ipomoea nil TaxID=35883 RepID=UPI000900850F|nr:PREDICTED: protein FAR1-RELATED SEQUENCE 5-like [Ipomoea nil]